MTVVPRESSGTSIKVEATADSVTLPVLLHGPVLRSPDSGARPAAESLFYARVRRVVDVLFCVAVAPLAVPLIAILAAAIVADSPGSPFYLQWRTGYRGRRFRMIKLRTMVRGADALKNLCTPLNRLSPPDFKAPADPRVTRVGRVLRRLSLDEMPQLWNVLVGDMTLIGPRPTSFSADHYQPWQVRRLEVVPGLTGLSQVRGRSALDFEQRVMLDLEYIDRRSLALDLRILAETVLAVLRGDGSR